MCCFSLTVSEETEKYLNESSFIRDLAPLNLSEEDNCGGLGKAECRCHDGALCKYIQIG